MHFLLIDTCTERGVISYGSSAELLFEKELPEGLNQSKFLIPCLVETLSPCGFPPKLDAIGVGMGPGSYTGIRIGVAVAQTLSYCWKVPLIGIPSLEGFIPTDSPVHFAAILDARIGGAYLLKGWSSQEGIRYEGEPHICSLEELGKDLEGVTHLVTPNAKSLEVKLGRLYPDRRWTWEEKGPAASVLLQSLERRFGKGEIVVPPAHLELLYLRETEAERNR